MNPVRNQKENNLSQAQSRPSISYGMKKLLFTLTILPLFVVGVALPVYGQEFDLVPCGDAADNEAMCTFADFAKLINNIIEFLIVVSIPIAVVSFTYAGFLFMTAGGNPGQIDKARSIFTKVAIGFVFVLAAWLIVYLIISNLLKDEITSIFF